LSLTALKSMSTGTRWTRRSHAVAGVGLLAGVLTLAGRPAGAFPGSTERASVDSAGNQSVGPSLAGPFAAPPSISADGRFVAFAAWARNLAPGDTNGFGDVFVHDRGTGTTERLSVDRTGTEANDTIHQPAISGDGHVALAKRWLAERRLPIGEIAERLGYSDEFAFRRSFRSHNGYSPSAYRRRATASVTGGIGH